VLEQWELDSRSAKAPTTMEISAFEAEKMLQENQAHRNETKLYLSIYALLRFVTLLTYLLCSGRID